MTTKRVIGYVGIFTLEQIEGFGLAVQRDGIRAYCKERRGYGSWTSHRTKGSAVVTVSIPGQG